MTTAIVLLRVEPGEANRIAEHLAALECVREIYSVTGRYDLVAVVALRDPEDLPTTVSERLDQMKGITSSETLLAFRVTSLHDMERMFSIGVD